MLTGGQLRIGMIHGRFQPFHEGHLEYFREAARHDLDVIIVGITNPRRMEASHQSDDHRHLPEANPFSFVERSLMISRTLEDEVQRREVMIIPFEIDASASWSVLPAHTVQFVNILEEWDEVKALRFREYGFPVQELHGRRVTSGTQVRDALRHGRAVDAAIPSGTRSVLEGWSG